MIRNGFDLGRYQAMAEALHGEPEAARLTFTGRFDWEDGFAGTARTLALQQAGGTTARPFVFRCDVPKEMLGTDRGSMPAERLLSALGHCLCTSYAVQATKRGIAVERIEVEFAGRLDLCGFLELSEVRPGLSAVEVRVRVQSDASADELRELGREAAGLSPMFDSLARPVPVDLRVARW